LNKITEAIRERVATHLFRLYCPLGVWELAPPVQKDDYYGWADQLLSIRLNDKLKPDPEGRYGIAVVDRKAEIPNFYPEYATACCKQSIRDYKKKLKGFVKEVSRDD
jgi:hypothetical protein